MNRYVRYPNTIRSFRPFLGWSLNSVFLAERASVLPNHAHFFPTETSVFDRHAEERVFVLLVVGGKGVLMEQHQFRVIRAGFRELWKSFSDGRDQAGLSLRPFVIGHRAMRIADSGCGRIPQMSGGSEEKVKL
jgi:hypothetical protein